VRSFSNFLNEYRDNIRLRTAANLIAEQGFDVFRFAKWYLDEGIYLDKNEINLLIEDFWGDTWKSAAKGAGVGAGAGGLVGGLPGAAVGGIFGGAAGGLYGAGKGLWNQWQGEKLDVTKDQALKVLEKLKTQTNNLNPEATKNFNTLIDKLIRALQNPSAIPAESPAVSDEIIKKSIDKGLDDAVGELKTSLT
jgi:hypothetical protein